MTPTHMLFQTRFLHERLATDGTHVTLITSVYLHVIPQVILPAKRPSADMTPKLPLARMCRHMQPKTQPVEKGFTTDLAGDSPFPHMHLPLMKQNVAWVPEFLAANTARWRWDTVGFLQVVRLEIGWYSFVATRTFACLRSSF